MRGAGEAEAFGPGTSGEASTALAIILTATMITEPVPRSGRIRCPRDRVHPRTDADPIESQALQRRRRPYVPTATATPGASAPSKRKDSLSAGMGRPMK
jgi:hypothetical protein